jgi:hypothetical protein
LINITVLSVTNTTVPTAKGSYQQLDVAYKNNTFQGKVEGKKLMSFNKATKAAFDTLANAASGTSFDIDTVKNDKGYIDWTSARAAGASASAPAQAAPAAARPAANAAPRSNYETPEERAQRQVYIVRQSSLNVAAQIAAVGAKKVDPDEVINLAKKLEGYVFGKEPSVKDASGGATGFDDVPDLDPAFEVE